MAVLDRISTRINLIVEHLLFVMGFGMALVVILQVFMRYALNQSLFWSEELARLLLVWLTFLGATVAYRRKAHVGVDVLYKALPEASQRAVLLLVLVLSLAFFGIMVFFGVKYAHFIRLQVTPALRLAKWLPALVLPLSGAIMLLHGLAFLLRELRGEEGRP